MIRIETHCLCGDDLVVSSSDLKQAMGIDAIFTEAHTGDGHQLFPTRSEATAARRKSAPAGGAS